MFRWSFDWPWSNDKRGRPVKRRKLRCSAKLRKINYPLWQGLFHKPWKKHVFPINQSGFQWFVSWLQGVKKLTSQELRAPIEDGSAGHSALASKTLMIYMASWPSKPLEMVSSTYVVRKLWWVGVVWHIRVTYMYIYNSIYIYMLCLTYIHMYIYIW